VAVRQKQAKKAAPVGKKLVTLFVVLALLVAGGVSFYQSRVAAAYSKHYMRALYGIKSGGDSGLAACKKNIAEAEVAAKEQRSYVFRVNPKEEARLTRIRGEVEKMMQQVADPPGKFAGANGQLTNLYQTYVQIHTLTIEPSRSTREYKMKVDRLDEEFRKKTQELAASLTGKLAKDLPEAKVKYRSLRDL
jgi:hypothetical protein